MIFEQFNKHGITWKDYYSTLPTLGVFLPLLEDTTLSSGLAKIDQFYADAAAGTLPSFSLVEPDYGTSVRRGPARRPVRRSVHGQGRQRRDVESQLADPPC